MRRIKYVSLVLCAVMIFALCGCGNKVQSVESNDTNSTKQTKADKNTLDLTQFNSTTLYSEVYNMMMAPDEYLGKTIKMSGTMAVYESEDPNKNYYACVIADATACCSQGIEFTLDKSYVYPDDYPQNGSDIVISGVFSKYNEDGYDYYALKDAVLL